MTAVTMLSFLKSVKQRFLAYLPTMGSESLYKVFRGKIDKKYVVCGVIFGDDHYFIVNFDDLKGSVTWGGVEGFSGARKGLEASPHVVTRWAQAPE